LCICEPKIKPNAWLISSGVGAGPGSAPDAVAGGGFDAGGGVCAAPSAATATNTNRLTALRIIPTVGFFMA
jgi:hypothetical protein